MKKLITEGALPVTVATAFLRLNGARPSLFLAWPIYAIMVLRNPTRKSNKYLNKLCWTIPPDSNPVAELKRPLTAIHETGWAQGCYKEAVAPGVSSIYSPCPSPFDCADGNRQLDLGGFYQVQPASPLSSSTPLRSPLQHPVYLRSTEPQHTLNTQHLPIEKHRHIQWGSEQKAVGF